VLFSPEDGEATPWTAITTRKVFKLLEVINVSFGRDFLKACPANSGIGDGDGIRFPFVFKSSRTSAD